jgi:hypothetical protein
LQAGETEAPSSPHGYEAVKLSADKTNLRLPLNHGGAIYGGKVRN